MPQSLQDKALIPVKFVVSRNEKHVTRPQPSLPTPENHLVCKNQTTFTNSPSAAKGLYLPHRACMYRTGAVLITQGLCLLLRGCIQVHRNCIYYTVAVFISQRPYLAARALYLGVVCMCIEALFKCPGVAFRPTALLWSAHWVNFKLRGLHLQLQCLH